MAWHGCVVSKQEFNDVAALADGGFIATHPTALRTPGDTSNLLGGQATGYVARWSVGTGEVEMPGTRIGYRIIAAGVAGVRGDCPAGSGAPCGQGFGVAQIDPATMEFHNLFDWQGKTSPIGGVSVALKVGNSVYLGASQGDRIVRMALKK